MQVLILSAYNVFLFKKICSVYPAGLCNNIAHYMHACLVIVWVTIIEI
jgi:hypothetical protein